MMADVDIDMILEEELPAKVADFFEMAGAIPAYTMGLLGLSGWVHAGPSSAEIRDGIANLDNSGQFAAWKRELQREVPRLLKLLDRSRQDLIHLLNVLD